MAFHYIWAVREAPKLHKKCIFQIGTLMPSASKNTFHLKIFFSRHHVSTNSLVYIHKPDTTHNSSNRYDEGLTLETSALELFKVANLHYQLN